ncbi:uncharacterized protein K441DRAFT_661294, partial [Cenococcum geophilum 1.58]|uniref:uncharacterized protein n=1 Tax=Cenococcum geophilum 1.58 TaxID=794803 RepID=UPI00358F8D64
MSLEMQMDDVKNSLFNQTQSLNNYTYIQLNSIQKWLDDQIEPITAYVQDGDCYRYIVAKGFPNRVKDFWRLISDPKTLIDLARHYSDTVIAHPYKCLRALAM